MKHGTSKTAAFKILFVWLLITVIAVCLVITLLYKPIEGFLIVGFLGLSSIALILKDK